MGPRMTSPNVVVHADWSIDPRKRWVAIAHIRDDLGYEVREVRLAPDMLGFVRHEAQAGKVLAGFDFPIGLPIHYARQTPFTSFSHFVAYQQGREFLPFSSVAHLPSEISIERPFYPRRPGDTSQRHLLGALKAEHMDQLRRLCERRTASRRAACSVFWTLGGNQVGKACLAGLREVVGPLWKGDGRAAVWPFDGDLRHCLDRADIVICETYPGEAYQHIGVRLPSGGSKRRQTDRSLGLANIARTLERYGITLAQPVRALVDAGFGDDACGEDRFDAFVGLIGMLAVVRGYRDEGFPVQRNTIEWEGWIFGQAPEPALRNGRSDD
jgi:hypothetical protein